jgi:phosphonoacetaldehyde hydrolase
MSDLKHIKAVIFDWAGTIIDYGCMAPTQVFISAFHGKNVIVSATEARGPMGLAKKDHVREIFRLSPVQKQWVAEYGHFPDETDVNEIYAELEPSLTKIVKNFSTPIPGAVEIINKLKELGIKVGTTTGYVSEMMDNILPVADSYGLVPDAVVNSSEVPFGRPAPWMIFKNCEQMNVFPLNQVVKIGDTIADIQEGINAGAWTIGVTKSGNGLGLSLDEVEKADPVLLKNKLDNTRQKFLEAGADFVVEGVWDCWPILEEINHRIEANLKK